MLYYNKVRVIFIEYYLNEIKIYHLINDHLYQQANIFYLNLFVLHIDIYKIEVESRVVIQNSSNKKLSK